jgi:hypothetical protein
LESSSGGGLLHQVSVVYPRQVVPVVVGGRGKDVVRFRVLSWHKENETLSQDDDDDDDDNDNDDGNNHYQDAGQPSCLRLVASTRVIVIPPDCLDKKSMDDASTAVLLRIYPGLLDYQRAMRELASSFFEKDLVAVDQCCAVVHSDAAPWFSTRCRRGREDDSFLAVIESNRRDENNGTDSTSSSSSSNSSRSLMVRVRTSSAVPLDGIGEYVPMTRFTRCCASSSVMIHPC